MNRDYTHEVKPMSKKTNEPGTQALSVVDDVAENVHLVARDADEMKRSTEAMAEWFRGKQEIAARDQAELEESLAISERNGWQISKQLKRQAAVAARRTEFYEKCRLALDAGYVIIPNLPADVFAIRTKRKRPDGYRTEPQLSAQLPAGEGETRNPVPSVQWQRRPDDPRADDDGDVRVSSWQEIEFPISVARPEVMNETQRAMALKVFDEMGVVNDQETAHERRQSRRRGDPLVIGRIKHYRAWATGNQDHVTFLLAWYVDVSAFE